jgi:Rrf2 family iron-sulfur cluster assembly transcriptional regulator
MKLGTKGRYAVMAMVDLANISSENGRPVSLSEIAIRLAIPHSYLEQLLGKLRRCGLVKSVRGPGGGYLLSRNYEEIRISDIVTAADEQLSATRCMPGSAEGCNADKSRCLTHDLWDELSKQITMYLNSVSLADVCEKRIIGTSSLQLEREINHQTSAANV